MKKLILVMLVIALISMYVSAQGVVPIGLIATPQKVVIAGGSTTIKGVFPSHYRVYNKLVVMPTNTCSTKRYIDMSGTPSPTPGWLQGNFEMNLNLGDCFYEVNETVNATNLTNRCVVAGPCTYQNKDLTAFSYACYVNANKTWTCGWYSIRLNYSVIKPADTMPPAISAIEPNAVLFVKKSFNPNDPLASLDLYNLKDVNHIERFDRFDYSATASDCSNIENAHVYLNNEGNILTGATTAGITGMVTEQSGECLCDPSEIKTVYINKTIFCSNPRFTGIGYSTAVEKISGAAITGGQNLSGGVCEPGGPIPNPQQYGSFTPEPICASGTATLYTGCNTITAVATDAERNFEERSQPFYVVPQGNSRMWAQYTKGATGITTIQTISACTDGRPIYYNADNSPFTAQITKDICIGLATQCQGNKSMQVSCYHSAVWVDFPKRVYVGISYKVALYNFYVNGVSKSSGSNTGGNPQVKSIDFNLQKGWNYLDFVLVPTDYDYGKPAELTFVSGFDSSVEIRNPGVRPDALLYPRRDYNPRGNMGVN